MVNSIEPRSDCEWCETSPICPIIASHLSLHPFQVTTFTISHFGSTQESFYPSSSAPIVVIHSFNTLGDGTYNRFTQKTEDMWPLHFKHSHGWERRSWFKCALHYAWGTNWVSECKMDVKSTWIPTWHQTNHVSWSLGIFCKNHLLEVGLTQN